MAHGHKFFFITDVSDAERTVICYEMIMIGSRVKTDLHELVVSSVYAQRWNVKNIFELVFFSFSFFCLIQIK